MFWENAFYMFLAFVLVITLKTLYVFYVSLPNLALQVES